MTRVKQLQHNKEYSDLNTSVDPLQQPSTTKTWIDDNDFINILHIIKGGLTLKSALDEYPKSEYFIQNKIDSRWPKDSQGAFYRLLVCANRHKHYMRAREIQMLALTDELLEIADNSTNETYQSDRLAIDARKFLSSKLAPKIFGDRQHLDVSGEIKHSILDVPRSEDKTAWLERKKREQQALTDNAAGHIEVEVIKNISKDDSDAR